jgi:hypothetical protein
MSRVMRRTPYMGVRFAFKTLADGSRGYVAVRPCSECAAWKSGYCERCPPATNREIERAVYEKIVFHHNFNEDYGRRLRSLELEVVE